MKIVWTKSAEITFQEEIDFILLKWSSKEALKFIDLIDGVLERLKDFPTIGRHSEKSGDFFLAVSKQTTLIYRVSEDDVLELLLFWNNQKNPEDLKAVINKQNESS